MIADLLKKEELRKHVGIWMELVVTYRRELAKGPGADPKFLQLQEKHQWKEKELAALEEFLHKAEAGFQHPEDVVYIAPEVELSILQTIMEQTYTEAGMVERHESQALVDGVAPVTASSLKEEFQPSGGQKLFYTAFDEPNPRFITEGAKAVAYRLLNGLYPFSDSAKTFALADRARLILVGDWGSGIDRAAGIARMMAEAARNADGRECHMIHLGDIYFCGWPEECRDRFLALWPVKEGSVDIHSWCLNGNHDMYCGGEGYFNIVLGDSRFQKQGGCSYFALENAHWQILGLDSAYSEWSLHGKQVEWALKKQQAAPAKRTILMSHHQPFSDYEVKKEATALLNHAAPLLKGQTAAWLWGHEHRAVVYKGRGLQFPDGTFGKLPLGACLGNGGVPARPTKLAKDPTSHHAETGSFRVGLEKFGLFGFAILDIDGDQAALTVVNEKGEKAGPFAVS